MPDKKQWEQLRNLDKLAKKAQRGTFRERYLYQQINLLRGQMGLTSVPVPARPTRSKADASPDEQLSNGLSADAKLTTDSGATHTLFDVEPGDS
jgi:hypothetical protein